MKSTTSAAAPFSKSIFLSFEFTDGTVKDYGFHLGTDIALARKIAEEKMENMDFEFFAGKGKVVKSAGLSQGHKLVDCYIYGQWTHRK